MRRRYFYHVDYFRGAFKKHPLPNIQEKKLQHPSEI